MGTSYSFDGGINIVPALNYAEIKTARKTALEVVGSVSKKYATVDNVFEEYMPLSLMLDSFEKDTDEGPLKVTRAIALEAPKAQWFMPINMDVLLRALIKALPGHNWTGTVTAIHEDRMSGYKLTVNAEGSGLPVDDPKVVRQVKGSSYLVWDDEPDSPDVLSQLL